ncbi:FAD-dependent monooxygenase [Streptomyces sp. ST2-7A]|uniref:FAD-dependent monooxygenase n=1 Tax=Streptomyces sp. ST2-7A TaxID=2907214 RepID=UPI001F42AF7D|nr:FAD-dependent monooxygenase [Streptomyces sp. ST2-7A]MCE7081209.1 FAD-dependent monooxygenase [Streptomyces sp. ST2-7A]
MLPVIIAGAGPIGLALALALSRHGVPSVVLDGSDAGVVRRAARTCVLPPDVAHWARLSGAAEHATTWTGWRTTVRGRVVEEAVFTEERSPVHLPQHALEEALWRATGRTGLVEILSPARLVDLEQHESGVTAHLAAEPAGGASSREGSHLIGCDGARSTVRKLLGVAFPGRTAVERYAVAALRGGVPETGEAALHRALPTPRRTGGARAEPPEVLVRPLLGDEVRLDWPLPPEEGPVTPDALLERVERTLVGLNDGELPPHELLDTGVYACHQRLARWWRSGRVLLAGDAAHLVGALGTQQVAEGLRDVDNLAWKLAADRRPGGAEGLLESYVEERRGAMGARLRAVDQALPVVRGRGGRGGRLTGRGRLTLPADAHLGRGALGEPGRYAIPGQRTAGDGPAIGNPVVDVAVTALDGERGRLVDRLGGPLLLVLTAPGARVWDARHWLSAGLMPDLAGAVSALPLPAELLVADAYPDAAAHTLLVVRPDGRLAAALAGADRRALERCIGDLTDLPVG